MNFQNNVIILGGEHHNTLGVIRSLGTRGVLPYVVFQSDRRKPYVARSRYIKQYWVVKTDEQTVSLLLSDAIPFRPELGGGKSVLIACSDEASSLIDLNRDKLAERYLMPGSKEQGHITRLMDKEVMARLAEQTGFNIPRHCVINLSENLEIDFPMPWITKPLMSKAGSKTDIKVIRTEEDWQRYLKEGHCENLQIEQFIEHEYEYQLIGGALPDGKIVIPGVSNVIRPSDGTNTGFLKYSPLADYPHADIATCEKFIHATGYRGLFSMEFLHGKDGKDYFMEINFRNDGNAICVTAAGVNLPLIWCLGNLGLDYSAELKPVKTIYANPEIKELHLLLVREISLAEFMEDRRKTDVYMEAWPGDNAPYRAVMRDYLWNLVQKTAGRILHS